jgi:hypothetical protein
MLCQIGISPAASLTRDSGSPVLYDSAEKPAHTFCHTHRRGSPKGDTDDGLMDWRAASLSSNCAQNNQTDQGCNGYRMRDPGRG